MMAISINERFLSKEERHGFTITPTMKKCWAVQLRIVSELEKICQKYNLKYFAYWGTMLGAVREHGMIPWDDDVDIAMTRDDFRVLVSVIDELPDTLTLIGKDRRNFPFNGFYRIVNTNNVRWDDEFLENNYGFPMSAGIDLFIFDYIPRDTALLNRIKEYTNLILDTVDLILHDPQDPGLAQKILNVEKYIGVRLDPASDRSIIWQLQTIYEELCSLTEEAESDEMGMYNHIFNHDPGLRFPKNGFDQTLEVPFENGTIRILADYDRHLAHRFGGSYLIPVNTPAAHGYPSYRKQLQVIADYCADNNTDEPVRKCHLEDEMRLYGVKPHTTCP
jgi:lipopolysaccharide cholinephosphotransferase